MTPEEQLQYEYLRLQEALYACAREYGEALNLELKVKHIAETNNKKINIHWTYIGNPEEPHVDDTLVATFGLEDL